MGSSATYTELSDEQLVHAVLTAERHLVTHRFQHSMNTLEDTSGLAKLRKSIARMRTEARGRELAAGLRKDELFRTYRKTFEKGELSESAPAAEEKGGFLSGIVDKLTGKE